MKVTFLGTGTSHGIPVIACSCPVCTSKDFHDKRYRSSIMLEKDGKRIVIDTGYEFRLQMLANSVTSLDAVLYTHMHADHVAGMDDLRVFSRHTNFPLYGDEKTLTHLKEVYPYAFGSQDRKGVPHLTMNILEPYEKVNIKGFEVTPIPVMHGRMPIYAYRIGSFAYVTDTSFISEESYKALQGVKTLVIGALRSRPHETHFSFAESYEASLKIGAEKVYFTHICHDTCYNDINKLYPGFVESAYDNLVLNLEE